MFTILQLLAIVKLYTMSLKVIQNGTKDSEKYHSQDQK